MSFDGMDYIRALTLNYPDLLSSRSKVDERVHVEFIQAWLEEADEVGVDGPDRFCPIEKRGWSQSWNAWTLAGGGRSVRRAAAYGSYKGLINLKPAYDLALYQTLIWELQPKTIIEFGSLQGGSGMWFADQLQALCGAGEVHSFDLLDKCVHPRAVHPRLHFHHADLRDLKTLDEAFFTRLAHPWLVIDDAHENIEQLARYLSRYLVKGDYYVIEDAFLNPVGHEIAAATRTIHELGLLVDTKYTDAFGYNVTCAPNGWLVKA